MMVRNVISMKALYKERSSKTYIYYITFNVTFIIKSHGDAKRRCII